MTTPVVEQIRNIPLIVDREYSCDPMAGGNESDDEESGFPFDRDFDRNRDGFRSQLDDIAQRHPEFAEHLGGFPFRQTRTHRTEEPEFRRFTDRPFGSRFDRYFQPDSYDENPAAYQQYYEARPEYYPPQEEQVEKEQATEEKPPKAPERGRKVQQSNTVDLGQKQEPVNDRNQRSMSAPPSENRTGQRFVSSINIPMGGGGSATSASASSDPPQQPQPAPQSNANKPTERVIPIHVEGRDEPVIPKSTHSNFGQASQSYTQHPPQPERIFGQRPEQFSQFLRREPRQFNEWRRPQQGPSPDELLRQQQQQYQKEQEQRFKQQQAAPQQQAPPQAPQPQAPEPQPQPQPPQQPAPPTTPIDQIHAIQEDVSQLIHQVEQFGGKPRDKQYLYLDEMLTRNLIKLDNIDTQGLETIRSARKEAIKCIEKCISLLEAKAASNVQGQVSEPAQEPSKEPEQMEVAESQEEKPQEEIMEVTPEVKVEEKHEATPEVTEEKPASAEAPSQQAEEVKEEKKDKKKGKKKVADAEKK